MSNWKKSFVKLKTVRGWLFDVYPSGSNKMIVWIITENGQRVKLVDTFTNRIYVSGKFSDLKKSIEKIRDNRSAAGCRLVEKHADFMDAAREKVLEINMKDYHKTSFLARELLKLGGYEKFRLYNVDIPLSQAYLYEKDVFPLAHVLIVDDGKKLCFDILDSVESVDYSVPPLRSMWLNVSTKREGMLRRLSDNIDSISLELDNKTVVLSEGTEKDKILKLVETVKKADPDIIFTCGGDSFLFPYLAYRAFINGVLNRFILSREDIPLKIKKSKGKTFFSYGKIYHKAPMCRLYGRVHVDSDNTFIYTACGLEGLIEVSRTCRVPLQRAARASIGSIMSSLTLHCLEG